MNSVLYKNESVNSDNISEDIHFGDCPFGRTVCGYPRTCVDVLMNIMMEIVTTQWDSLKLKPKHLNSCLHAQINK